MEMVSHNMVVKVFMFVCKNPKINKKEAGDDPLRNFSLGATNIFVVMHASVN